MKKIKLFEDYVEPLFEHKKFIGQKELSLKAVEMLNDLAEQIHELDKDNNYLRGWLTEMQHKMDFVMEHVDMKDPRELSGILLDNLSAEASTASIRISFFDSDNPTVKRTPNASTLKFCIDPENTQGKPSEWIRCVSHSTSNGITTLSTVTRGLQRDHTYDLTGSASRAQSWDASTVLVGVSKRTL